MQVLVACEYSAIVRDAFRAKGHDAWSCDILPTEGDPAYHIQGDVLDILNDGWDMMIGHPPCTRLSNSGVKHLYYGTKKENGIDPEKWREMEEAGEQRNMCSLQCSGRAEESLQVCGFLVCRLWSRQTTLRPNTGRSRKAPKNTGSGIIAGICHPARTGARNAPGLKFQLQKLWPINGRRRWGKMTEAQNSPRTSYASPVDVRAEAGATAEPGDAQERGNDNEALEALKRLIDRNRLCGGVWIKLNKNFRPLLVPQWGKKDMLEYYHENDLFMGGGYTTRKNAEFCLLGRRGSPKRLCKSVHEVIISPRREHSRKPDEARKRIEKYAAGPYLELFARETVDGWVSWGNETDKFS